MLIQQNAQGNPDWEQARGVMTQIMQLPSEAPEAEITTRLYIVLRCLFPDLEYPAMAIEGGSGSGPMDIRLLEVILEVKGKGKRHATHKYAGENETPEEQLLRYLKAPRTTNTGSDQQHLFPNLVAEWKGVITDGIEWDFYDYDHENRQLDEVKKLLLQWSRDIENLLRYLYNFVGRATPSSIQDRQ